jgi:hypothetical protein
MGTIRVGGVWFEAYPGDHTPRHVHAFVGSAEVILDLGDDGTVALAKRKTSARRKANASEIRKAVRIAITVFDQLVALWETTRHDR